MAQLIDNLYIFDLSDTLVAVLTPDDINTPFSDGVSIEQLNRNFNLNFVVPANNSKANFIIEGNQVAYKDLDGNFQLFEIKRIEEVHEEVLLKTVFCEHAIFELLDEFITFNWQRNQSAFTILTQALVGTRWSAGIVTVPGLSTVRMELDNPIQVLFKMIEAFNGGEFRYRVTISGTSISTRYVDFLVQRGANTGKRFEYTKDLVFIQKEVDFTNLKTQLYGFGKAEEVPGGIRRVRFSDVIWTSPPDPLNKPLGQEYLEDPTATAIWGRAGGTRPRIGVFEDPDITDPNELLERTYQALKELSKPKLSYSMRIVDLERISGFTHEEIRLGDTVAVIDREFKPELFVEARIVEIKRYLTEPEKDEIILDSFRPLSVEDGFIIADITSRIQNTQGVWQDSSYSNNMINDHSFENIPRAGAPDANQVYNVLKTVPDYGSPLWWQWTGAGPTTGKVISTYDGTTLLSFDQLAMFDFQAGVVDTDSKPYQYVRLHKVVGINGPYTASAYVSAYSQTVTDGIARLEVYANDSTFTRLNGGVPVGIATINLLSANKDDWKRISVTMADTLPATTEYLEVFFDRDSSTPNLKYLVDGVQLVPLDSTVTYQPESQLWRHMRRFPGLKLTFPTFDGDVTIREGNLVIPNAEAFSAYQSTAKLIPNGTWTIIDYDIELFDPENIYNNATYKFTTQLATGRFIVTAKCRLDNLPDGTLCAMAIFKNNVEFHKLDAKVVGGTNDPQLSGSCIVDIVFGDSLDIRVIQISGLGINTLPNQTNTHLQAHRLS